MRCAQLVGSAHFIKRAQRKDGCDAGGTKVHVRDDRDTISQIPHTWVWNNMFIYYLASPQHLLGYDSKPYMIIVALIKGFHKHIAFAIIRASSEGWQARNFHRKSRLTRR